MVGGVPGEAAGKRNGSAEALFGGKRERANSSKRRNPESLPSLVLIFVTERQVRVMASYCFETSVDSSMRRASA
jgi:hypothetical protein